MLREPWMVRALWFMGATAGTVSGLILITIAVWPSLWWDCTGPEQKGRRKLVYIGGVLLVAAAAIFVGLR